MKIVDILNTAAIQDNRGLLTIDRLAEVTLSLCSNEDDQNYIAEHINLLLNDEEYSKYSLLKKAIEQRIDADSLSYINALLDEPQTSAASTPLPTDSFKKMISQLKSIGNSDESLVTTTMLYATVMAHYEHEDHKKNHIPYNEARVGPIKFLAPPPQKPKVG